MEAASVDDRTNIPFNHIYRLTKDPKITAIHNLRDEDIEGFVIRDNKNKLMRYLAEKQVQGKINRIDSLFKTGNMDDYKLAINDKFSSLCNDEDIDESDIPLILYEHFRADKGQPSTMQSKNKIPDNFEIDNKSFVRELNSVIQSLLLRNNTISELLNHLRSKSITM